MSIIAAVVAELEYETITTRRLLECVPEGHWGWKPHEKSMPLSRLASHTAEIYGWGEGMLNADSLDMAEDFQPFAAQDVKDLLQTFDRGAASFHQALGKADASKLGDMWSLTRGSEVLFSAPRMPAMRSFVLNHVVHHRGQLTVYLRLLDVPLPQIYGPTADAPIF